MNEKQETFHIVYRVESKKTHIGPFRDREKNWARTLDKIDKDYENDNYPTPWTDFPNGELIAMVDSFKVGLHVPCLYLFWFGMHIDAFHDLFALYKLKVRKYSVGKSNIQCIFDSADIISEELLIDFSSSTLKRKVHATKHHSEKIS